MKGSMDWITNRCSCDDNPSAVSLFRIRDLNFRATPQESNLMRCVACGALYPDIFPAAASIGEAYREYYTEPQGRAPWRASLRKLVDRSRSDYLDRRTPRAARRILDYGSGAGDYLARMARFCAKSDLVGADRGEAPGSSLPYTWLGLEGIASVPRFDWVTLGHVLEHVDDPGRLLTNLATVLEPDGGLWIATPNACSFLFEAAGAWARDVDFPRHRS